MSLKIKEKLHCPNCYTPIPSIYSQKYKKCGFKLFERCSSCGRYMNVFKSHFCDSKKGKPVEISFENFIRNARSALNDFQTAVQLIKVQKLHQMEGIKNA